jgi:broad specificity phosphatase PhoE
MVLKNPSEYQKGKTFVYLVRHGDRIFIKGGKDEGLKKGGPGLSALGKKQAKSVAREFLKLKGSTDVFISSSMTRALETANEIGKVIKKKPKVYDELCEFNQIVMGRKYYHYNFWKHYFKHRISLRIFDKILEQNKGKVIVIVAHGNIIKGIIGKKLGLSLSQIARFDYHNCHVTLARFKGTKLDYIHCFNSKGVIIP